jgi:hypothetical protein
MKSMRVFVLAGFFLLALIGANVMTPGQDAWAVDLNVDITPDRDSGIDVDVVPDDRDRDREQDRRFHDQQQERHQDFHQQQEHEEFHRDQQERDRAFHDSTH